MGLAEDIEAVVKAFGELDLPYYDYSDEFILYRFAEGDWRAEIGNRSNCVLLGETDGIFQGKGNTAFMAVLDLRLKISEGIHDDDHATSRLRTTGPAS